MKKSHVHSSTSKPRKPPSRFTLLLEARALVDVASLPLSLLRGARAGGKKNVPGALPIILFPGFGSNEIYLKPLEYYLRQQGYRTEGWGLGANLAGTNLDHTLEDLAPHWEIDYPASYHPDTYRGEGGVPYLCDRAIERVRQRSVDLGSPVVLIGWSLGGYIARECARELEQEVAQVITLGAPVVGGPKYSRAADYFKAKQFDLDWIEQAIDKRNSKLIQQPITAIYSESDGIVSATAAVDEVSPNVTNLKVGAAHLGMGFNQTVWRLVSQALHDEATKRML